MGPFKFQKTCGKEIYVDGNGEVNNFNIDDEQPDRLLMMKSYKELETHFKK